MDELGDCGLEAVGVVDDGGVAAAVGVEPERGERGAQPVRDRPRAPVLWCPALPGQSDDQNSSITLAAPDGSSSIHQ